MLKSHGFIFDEEKIARNCLDEEENIAFLRFGVVKIAQLSELSAGRVKREILEKDLKTCKEFFPFMKEIRKQKILTFFMCMRRMHKKTIPREIIWMILDFAYSSFKLKAK